MGSSWPLQVPCCRRWTSGDHARTAVGFATRRPKATGWAVVRALLVIAVGLLIVLFPTISSQVVAVVAGLVVLFYGVTELDVIAERSRAQDEAEEAAALAGLRRGSGEASLTGALADPRRRRRQSACWSWPR